MSWECAPGQHIRNALFHAVQRRAANVADALLRCGDFVDINAVNSAGMTPLHFAVQIQNVPDLVSTLLHHKAAVNKTDKDGRTALMHAARIGNVWAVEHLLEAHADIDMCDIRDRTALAYAIENSHTGITKLLLEHGADVHVRGRLPAKELPGLDGWTRHVCLVGSKSMYAVAVAHANYEVIALLRDKHSIVAADEQLSVLCAAIYSGDAALVQQQYEAGAKPHDWTAPMLLAIAVGNLAIVQQLVQYGADVNSRQKYTPLEGALRGGDPDVVDLLIASGADVTIATAKGNLPLVHVYKTHGPNLPPAWRHVTHALATAMHARGPMTANVLNSRDANRKTVLMHAVACGDARAVECLLRCAPQCNIRGKDGCTALHMAVCNGDVGIVRILVASRALAPEARVTRSGKKRRKTQAQPITPTPTDCNIDAADHVGITPLMLAVRHLQTEIVDVLLQAGADINAASANKFTVRAGACRHLVRFKRLYMGERRCQCYLRSGDSQCAVRSFSTVGQPYSDEGRVRVDACVSRCLGLNSATCLVSSRPERDY